MSAQVNVAARKEELIAAQGDLELAWAELREAMGAPDLKASELKPIEPHTFPQLPLEQEMATAAKTRPDLMALGQAQSAQGAALGAAKSDFGPRVSAYGNWEEDRTSFAGSGGNNWVAGVQISVDILPAGRRAQLARESAAKQRIDAQLAASRQHVRIEVSQAHIHRQTAYSRWRLRGPRWTNRPRVFAFSRTATARDLPPSPICCEPRMPRGRANPTTGTLFTAMPWLMPNCYTRQGR